MSLFLSVNMAGFFVVVGKSLKYDFFQKLTNNQAPNIESFLEDHYICLFQNKHQMSIIFFFINVSYQNRTLNIIYLIFCTDLPDNL